MSTIFEDKLQHKIPIEQSDINYYLVDTKQYRPDTLSADDYDKVYRETIQKAQQEVADNYHAEFRRYEDVTPNDEKIHYFLFGLIDPSKIDNELKSKLIQTKSMPNSRVNVAMIFEKNKSDQATATILELDKSLGINTIYQDTDVTFDERTYLTISSIDAADNMVCETFRVKYKTIKRHDDQTMQMLQAARDQVWPDVQSMQSIYERYKLWHRSPYDGAFMFRTQYGWLTTATRTAKDNVRKQDLSLILDFDETNETTTYAGDRLPSSDLPEFFVLVERNEQALAAEGERTPVIKYMAHFHKNEITRNSDFRNYAVPFYRYGVPESGHRFADELLQNGRAADGINIHGKGRGFIILEHGLVRMGVKLEHLEDFLQNFELNQG